MEQARAGGAAKVKKKPDYTVDAVVRSLKILEALGRSPREMGVLELSKSVHIHVSTVYRLLNTLMNCGFVDQNPDTDKYRLGIKLFELGMARIQQMDFRAVALPFLTELHDRLGETVLFGIARDAEVLILEVLSSFRGIVFSSAAGAGEPLYCTGIGKALLAHLPHDEQETLIRRIRLKSHTPSTITQKRVLKRELEQIRQQGFAVDNEEVDLGVKCVAAPILNHQGHAVAAFSVPGPKARIEQNFAQIVEQVLQASREISRQLGYVPSS